MTTPADIPLPSGPWSALLTATHRRHPTARVVSFTTTPSTNTEAKTGHWPHGSVLVATHQTGGRGQHGRPWTHHRDNLAASWVVEGLPAPTLPLLGLFTGLCTARALEHLGLSVSLKWPNDVVIGGGKLAGILVEGVSLGSQTRAIVGLGLNVVPVEVPPGEEPHLPPTSLKEAGVAPAHRLEVLAWVLEAFWRDFPLFQDATTWLADYRGRMAFKGKTLTLDLGEGRTETGVITGVDETGRLLATLTKGGEQALSHARILGPA